MVEHIHHWPLGSKRMVAGSAALLVAFATAIATLGPMGSRASSHREAPLISGDPQADNTDVYAFVSADSPNTVSLVASWIPFEEPAGGPNFYFFAEGANYDINIDNDGDAQADIVFRWVFTNHYRNPNTFVYNTGFVDSLTDPDLNFFQTYDLFALGSGDRRRTLVDDGIVVPSYVGEGSMGTPEQYEANLFNAGIHRLLAGGGKTWAGQSDDAFFLDLRVFDLLYGGDLSEVGDDTLAGFNVNTVALQVPKRLLAARGDRSNIIGVWSTTSRPRVRVNTKGGEQIHRGGQVQVSRLGMALVNEVVIPVGLKDRFNASKPENDEQFLEFVLNSELARLLNAVYNLGIQENNRTDLVTVFLTGIPGLNQPPKVEPSEMLRLNMSIPPCEPGSCAEYSRLGVIGGDNAGYPNGRRLADDVIDISIQVVVGELIGNPNDLGDGVDTNDVPFGDDFPYVVVPHSGSDPDPH
jgi:hypothetical protein